LTDNKFKKSLQEFLKVTYFKEDTYLPITDNNIEILAEKVMLFMTDLLKLRRTEIEDSIRAPLLIQEKLDTIDDLLEELKS
jgi:hypothetical protein